MENKLIKLNCPVCNSKVKPLKEKGNEIIVCKECENSLFMYNHKGKQKLVPFSLNAGIEGNKLVSNQDFDEESEFGYDFDDEDEEDYD